MNRRSLIVLFIFTLLIAGGSLQAQQRVLTGQVVDIVDGKTVVVQAATGRISVELQFIDVPPAGQPMFDTVKEHLRALAMGKMVEYRIRNIMNDRSVGRLTASGVDISQQMLRDGAAWHVPVKLSGQEPADFQLYASTEAAAKNEKRGLWASPDLKPSWERPVEAKAADRAPVPRVSTATAVSRPRGVWGDKNPRLGNVGALMNGYNAATREGYLSTSPLGVEMKDGSFDGKLALDLTYLYKENDGKGRRGIYIVTLFSESRTTHFRNDHNIYVITGGKKISLGRPEYSARSDGFGQIREMIRYRISRENLDRLMNDDEAFLKSAAGYLYLAGGRYLVYNMLQLTN